MVGALQRLLTTHPSPLETGVNYVTPDNSVLSDLLSQLEHLQALWQDFDRSLDVTTWTVAWVLSHASIQSASHGRHRNSACVHTCSAFCLKTSTQTLMGVYSFCSDLTALKVLVTFATVYRCWFAHNPIRPV